MEKLRESIKSIVNAAKKYGRTPSRVIIVRDGLSEGQMEMAVRQELTAIKQGYRDAIAGGEAEPKFTFIVATKQHNKRFFQFLNNKVENTKTGNTVVSKVTRSDVKEFYLQTHHPLKASVSLYDLDFVTGFRECRR